MMQKIILHIGGPKCASTFLQRVLLKNQSALTKSGVLYPHPGPGHPGNAQALPHITRPWLEDKFSRADTVILSHETLFALPSHGKRLSNLLDGSDIGLDILVALRPFPDWLAADYSQTLRQSFKEFCTAGTAFGGRSFDQFVRARYRHYAVPDFLNGWRDLFPDAAMHVCNHVDLRDTAIRLCPQLADIDWALPAWRTNPSLPQSVVAQIANLLNAGDRDAALNLQSCPPQSAPSMPPSTRAWINRLFAPERAQLAQDYGWAG